MDGARRLAAISERRAGAAHATGDVPRRAGPEIAIRARETIDSLYGKYRRLEHVEARINDLKGLGCAES